MKTEYTQVVATTATTDGVEISFRMQGSDSSEEPTKIRVTPHNTYIHLSLGHAEFADGGNHKSIPITKVP